MRKTIAIDMDGVLADVEAQFITWYERDYGMQIPRENFIGVPERDAFPDKSAVRKFVTSPGFFRNLPLMPGAVEAVQKLMEDYEVYIVSAAMEFPLSLPEKYDWLKEHFPAIGWHHIVFCGNKGIINTDFMIDDHPKNLDVFKGRTLMFSAGHNANYNTHTRVDSWADVLAYFASVENEV